MITRKIMRGTAFEKANKYYHIYQDRQNSHYLDIREDCLEISLYYFSIYFILLKQDIEKEYGFRFLAYDSRGDMVEHAFSGIPLLRYWRIKNQKSPEEKRDNPFYEDSSSLFKSAQIALVLQRLINNYDESKLTQVMEVDNFDDFLKGRKRFRKGLLGFREDVLDNFSFFFYRVRNHLTHAGKNMEDAREKEIMEDMCMVLSEYTKTIQNKCKSLGI